MNLKAKEKFMKEAVNAALKGMNQNEGGPFGCVIVKDGKIIGRGNNKVTSTNNPNHLLRKKESFPLEYLLIAIGIIGITTS